MNEPQTLYIITALDAEGKRSYYNGKSGATWITDNKAEAFGYVSKTVAIGKATNFNRMTAIHGLRFQVVNF